VSAACRESLERRCDTAAWRSPGRSEEEKRCPLIGTSRNCSTYAITVPDIDEALEFYLGVLGLESVGSLRNEKTDGAALGFPGQEIGIHADHLSGKPKDNATVVDLIQVVKPATIVDERRHRETNHVGITRIAFEVEDIDAIYENLRTRGDIELLGQPAPVRSPTKGAVRILTFKDSHGIILELIELRPGSD
jgi:catechol 2,3-dioxygenase-like lactoylglutathione lyase family enzyme